MNNNSWFKKENPFQTVIGYGGGATGLSAYSSSATKTYIDDVFSAYLYTGNNSTQAINNGIDLEGEGGLVWMKPRTSGYNHSLYDTDRGNTKYLQSNTTAAQGTRANAINSFNANGFTLGTDANTNDANDFASWTFRKQKGFFDVVTYTGNGSNRDLSHSLGSIPGCIMVKRTDAVNEWAVYHRSIGTGKFLMLDSTTAALSNANFWYNGPTATTFGIGPHDYVNINGGTYVAYIFAGGESTAATAVSVDFGSGNSLSFPAISIGTNDFTIEAWVLIDSNANYPSIVDFRSSTADANGFFWGVNTSGTLYVYQSGTLRDTQDLSKNQWYHVALVRNGSTTTQYVNGIPSGAGWTDNQDYTNDLIKIGGANAGPNGTDWLGKISNLRITVGQALYTASFRPSTEPLTQTSQSATSSNVKLLCCNNSSVTGSTVAPGTITANGSPTASTNSPFDDPAGFKFGDSKEGIIKTGSYVGTGSAGLEVNLGWEPSFIMVKSASAAENWEMYDSMRGIATGGDAERLKPNTASSEDTNSNWFALTADGFIVNSTSGTANTTGDTYLFLAIRRPDGYVGKPPELGTGVFAMDVGHGTSTLPNMDSGFPVDFSLTRTPASTSWPWFTGARLTGSKYMLTYDTNAEQTASDWVWDNNEGWMKGGNGNTVQSWMWKRGAGFDVVTYAGVPSTYSATGVGSISVPHSLNAVPEMMWVKNRTYADANGWAVYHKGLNGGTNPEQYRIRLQDTNAEDDNVGAWQDTAPTSTHFTLGTDRMVNQATFNYVAMLFASVEDISKCGYYDGSNSTQTITVGFQPRFVIIKKTNSSSEWVVLDTTRGWGAGNDNWLQLNSTAAQVSSNMGAPTSTGFTVNAGVGAINDGGKKYIYYAHA